MNDKILQLTNDIASIFNYKLPPDDKRMLELSRLLEKSLSNTIPELLCGSMTPCAYKTHSTCSRAAGECTLQRHRSQESINILFFTISKCLPSTPFVKKIKDAINNKLDELDINAAQVINIQINKQTNHTYQIIISYKMATTGNIAGALW